MHVVLLLESTSRAGVLGCLLCPAFVLCVVQDGRRDLLRNGVGSHVDVHLDVVRPSKMVLVQVPRMLHVFLNDRMPFSRAALRGV